MPELTTPAPVELVAAIKDVCRLLCSAPLKLADVRSRLKELHLEAIVEPAPKTKEPAVVRVEISSSACLTLEALAQEFGSYKQLPASHRNTPLKYIYYIDWPEMPFVCALIAQQRRDAEVVEVVTVRRDKRL